MENIKKKKRKPNDTQILARRPKNVEHVCAGDTNCNCCV